MWYDLFFLGESLVSTHVQTDFYLEAQKQTDDRKDFDNVTNTILHEEPFKHAESRPVLSVWGWSRFVASDQNTELSPVQMFL